MTDTSTYEERRTEAIKEALAYLNEQPARVSLARGALKAALHPEEKRWEDE